MTNKLTEYESLPLEEKATKLESLGKKADKKTIKAVKGLVEDQIASAETLSEDLVMKFDFVIATVLT